MYIGIALALKEIYLPDSKRERRDVLEDFSKELRILSILKHPRIIAFYGATQSRYVYIVFYHHTLFLFLCHNLYIIQSTLLFFN